MLKMSFSKAKLKRFNDVPVVSSPSPFVEPKEKEPSKKSKKENKIKMGSLDAESIKTTKSALSLFRTPSLPRRLKFKHISDLTPKKSASKEAAKVDREPDGPIGAKATEVKPSGVPPIVQLYNKIDINKEALQKSREENEQLKAKIQELRLEQRRAEIERCNLLAEKDHKIVLLERELTSISKADELLQHIAEGCLEKVQRNEEEVRVLHCDYERQLREVHESKCDLEQRYDELMVAHKLLQDDFSAKESDNRFLNDEIIAMREILEAHDLELQSKIDEIKQMETALNELMVEGRDLREQVNYFKAQAEEDMMRYVEESRATIRDIDALKQENGKLLAQLAEQSTIIVGMQEELNEQQFESDDVRDELRNEFNQELSVAVKKYDQQIATMTEMNEMKIKECESIFILEKSKLIKEYSDKIKQMHKEHAIEIERIGEQAEEKIRIADIQNEERVKALELSIQSSIATALANEKSLWQKELDKCQKIAETEIMQCEFEKRDLRALWEASNEVIKEHENKIEQLEERLNVERSAGSKSRDEYENELKEIMLECTRLKTEKYNYQLTLNNTRSTVNILMERLKKSDGDVELLKAELDQVLQKKAEMETENNKLREEMEEHRRVLVALRASSVQLEKELREKDDVFEKMMNSEEDAILAVTQIGKLFNDKMEENLARYVDMYNEMKKKYDAREAYIQDMKTLLDEFATGIELARIELDTKDKKIFDLENENKDIKLENMTIRFKCEQFEKYQTEGRIPQPSPDIPVPDDDDRLVSHFLIENIINQLEQEGDKAPSATGHIELKEVVECEISVPMQLNQNEELEEKLKETEEKLRIVEEFAKETSGKYTELLENQNNRQKVKNIENNKDHQQLKAKIVKLQEINKKQESTIINLQQQLSSFDSPQKLNASGKLLLTASPKTPKKLIVSPFPGKENCSPAQATAYSPRSNILRSRNN